MSARPSDTALLDYLDAHPTAFFDWPDGPQGDLVLCEKDGPNLTGVMGLGSGPTVRDAIADAIAGERRTR